VSGAVDRNRRGIPFVVSAPSGTGKTTVCKRMLEVDEGLRLSISHTTRERRKNELDGRDYHFVSAREFREMVERGGFLEHAEYAGELYGSSLEAFEGPLSGGLDLIVEIEVQGARQIRDRLDEARLIFLLPPSLEVLEQRLRGRGTDEDGAIERRLALVDRELSAVSFFDYAVVNDDLDTTVRAVFEIIAAERRGETQDVRERFGRERAFERWQKRSGR